MTDNQTPEQKLARDMKKHRSTLIACGLGIILGILGFAYGDDPMSYYSSGMLLGFALCQVMVTLPAIKKLQAKPATDPQPTT